jgi:alkylation response protein AidB-like acyl-CoA dehydrogenase
MDVDVDEDVDVDDVDLDPAAALRAEARAWFEANWDPDQPLKTWWETLARSGWAFPTFPAAWFGKDLTPDQAAIVDEERRLAGAAPAPSTLGPRVIAPLILRHGTDEQKEEYLLPTIAGQAVWCELFSEPGAGSDLASLITRATKARNDHWIVNGQKVWTSGAPIARWGLLTARTEADKHKPKREGMTCFLLDMDSAGVDTRPLRTMTGEEKFSEVFLTDVRVLHKSILGDINQGWTLTKETLALERRALGRLSDNHKPPPLDKPAGALATVEQAGQSRGAMAAGAGALALIKALLDRFGPADDPVVRQEIARLYTLLQVSKHATRAEVVKLLTSKVSQTLRDLALRLEGPYGMLSGPDAPLNGVVQKIALTSPSMSIMTGTDEIHKNIIGERILGLPAEPTPTPQ